MAKKKKPMTNILFRKFTGEMLSVVANDDNEVKAIEAILQENDVPYIIGDLPQMQGSKVIGCRTQITVTDGKKLDEVMHKMVKP